MYRVTALKNGVVTSDVENFPTQEEVLWAMQAAAPQDYRDTLKAWLDRGAHELLLIKESSEWSDLWEYVP